MGFFDALDELLDRCEIRIDRLSGTAHPRHPDVVYPLDYGYLDGTVAGDGDGIDVFRGTASGAGVVGAYATVDLHKVDVELKLLVDCTPGEIEQVGDLLTDSLHLSPFFIPRT